MRTAAHTRATSKRHHQYPVVRSHMTPCPHTIAPNQKLATAHALMREHGIRHLPVLEAGKIIGVVSQRDLLLVETLPGATPDEVTVEEAMVQDVLTAAPDTPLAEVVQQMARRKAGSTVIVDEGRVVGVFTTMDALDAVAALLAER